MNMASLTSQGKLRTTITEFMKVGSHILQLELHSLPSSQAWSPSSLDDGQLRQEVLQLLTPVIKQYVEDTVKKKHQKKHRWRPAESTSSWDVDTSRKLNKPSAPVVVKGCNVKLAYTFKSCSSVHSILQPSRSRKGSCWEGFLVLPQRLVIYYCPFKNPLVVSGSSGYFMTAGRGDKKPLQGTLRNIVSKSGPKLSKGRGWKKLNQELSLGDASHTTVDASYVSDSQLSEMEDPSVMSSSCLNIKDKFMKSSCCSNDMLKDMMKHKDLLTTDKSLDRGNDDRDESVSNRDGSRNSGLHEKVVKDENHSLSSKISCNTSGNIFDILESDIMPLRDRLQSMKNKLVDTDAAPLPSDEIEKEIPASVSARAPPSESQQKYKELVEHEAMETEPSSDHPDRNGCAEQGIVSEASPSDEADASETMPCSASIIASCDASQTLSISPNTDNPKPSTKSPIFGMSPSCRKLRLLETRTYSSSRLRKAFRFRKPKQGTSGLSQSSQNSVRSSQLRKPKQDTSGTSQSSQTNLLCDQEENVIVQNQVESATSLSNDSVAEPTESGNAVSSSCGSVVSRVVSTSALPQSENSSDDSMDAGYDSGPDSTPLSQAEGTKSAAMPGHLTVDQSEHKRQDISDLAKKRQAHQLALKRTLQTVQRVTAELINNVDEESKNLCLYQKRDRRQRLQEGDNIYAVRSSQRLASRGSEDDILNDSQLPAVSDILNWTPQESEEAAADKSSTSGEVASSVPTRLNQQYSCPPPFRERSDSLDSNNAFETIQSFRAKPSCSQKTSKQNKKPSKLCNKNSVKASASVLKRKKAPDISKLFSDSESDENGNINSCAPTKKKSKYEKHRVNGQNKQTISGATNITKIRKEAAKFLTVDVKKLQLGSLQKKCLASSGYEGSKSNVIKLSKDKNISLDDCIESGKNRSNNMCPTKTSISVSESASMDGEECEEEEKERGEEEEDVMVKPAAVMANRDGFESEDSLIMVDQFTSKQQKMKAGLSGVSDLSDLKQDEIEWLVNSNEEYLRQIFQGKRHCQRHEDYKKGGHDRAMLKFRIPVGCFTEEQDDQIIRLLLEMFCKRHDKYADYVSRVILPEVCIKMAMDVFDVSHDEAEHHMALAMEASQDEMSLSQAMEVLKSGGDHSPGCKQQ